MTTSDSEDFESADEGGTSEATERNNICDKTLTNHNFKTKSQTTATAQGSSKDTLSASKLNDQKNKSNIASSETDGWDDFDIDDDIPNEKLNTSRNNKAQSKTKQPDIPNKTDGWGDFDDWVNEEPENMSDTKSNVHTEQELRSVADRLSAVSEKHNINEDNGAGSGIWGWGGWVSTITSHVSQGISTVTNALETSIGVPDPEELARKFKEDQLNCEALPVEEAKDKSSDSTAEENPAENPSRKDDDDMFGFGQIMSSVTQITKLVESTGTKVLHGGLDTLENIGKKTMQVLQEGDPGLVKKRAMLGLDSGQKPILSHILREAKERAEEEDRQRVQKKQAKEVHYETLFDDFAGLVHLEALEMLSKQSDMKIQSLLMSMEGEQLEELKETLSQVKELCELPEEDDEEGDDFESFDAVTISESFKSKLVNATQDIGVKINFEPIVRLWLDNLEWLLPQIQSETPDLLQSREVFKRAISCLAHTTALSVEMYHKTAEMMLVKTRRSTADEADGLTQLTTVLTHHISDVATLFTQLLGKMIPSTDNAEDTNTLITNVFLEAGNSSSYVQDAFQLTLPILQCGAT